MKFYYRKFTGVITETIDAASRPVNTTPTEGNWLTFESDAVPPHNPETQVLVPAYHLTNTELRVTYAVRGKTLEDLAREQLAQAKKTAQSLAKADAFVQQFVSMTPAEVTAYVEANVTSLVEAKALLSKMALMLLVLAKNQFQD
jgi:hypothetical protein